MLALFCVLGVLLWVPDPTNVPPSLPSPMVTSFSHTVFSAQFALSVDFSDFDAHVGSSFQ